MTERFTLQNEPSRPKPRSIEPDSKTRQTVLFAGMNCLPAQMDLFPTDGYDNEATDQSNEAAGRSEG